MDKPTVVSTQPTTVTRVSYGEKPNNYLVASIINILCCFFLLGVIALVFSLQVDSAWSSGNYEEAQRNANIAKILNIIGFVIGIMTWVAAIVVVIVEVAVTAAAVSQSQSQSSGRFG